MAQIGVLAAVQKVGVGQYGHVPVPDQESRIANKGENPFLHRALIPSLHSINRSTFRHQDSNATSRFSILRATACQGNKGWISRPQRLARLLVDWQPVSYPAHET